MLESCGLWSKKLLLSSHSTHTKKNKKRSDAQLPLFSLFCVFGLDSENIYRAMGLTFNRTLSFEIRKRNDFTRGLGNCDLFPHSYLIQSYVSLSHAKYCTMLALCLPEPNLWMYSMEYLTKDSLYQHHFKDSLVLCGNWNPQCHWITHVGNIFFYFTNPHYYFKVLEN